MNGEEVSGIFWFSEEGDFKSFEADRYYGGGRIQSCESGW